MKKLHILIWHVHGGYLYYLSQCPHEFYIPCKLDRSQNYSGRWGDTPWGPNVHDAPVEQIKNLDLDAIIFQTPDQYFEDQYQWLSPFQQNLPKIYLEHNCPQGRPAETKHWVDDPNVLLVHVTPYNALMWDNRRTPFCIIDHGVTIPSQVAYTGEIERGIVVVNHLKQRGRKLGADIYEHMQTQIPLTLVGMQGHGMPNGMDAVPHADLPALESHYRFFFCPIRYGSMALSVIEAMMVGLPIIGLATTEMATAIINGQSGYVDTNLQALRIHMQRLLRDPQEARLLGEGARKHALDRFGIGRFVHDWNKALAQVTS